MWPGKLPAALSWVVLSTCFNKTSVGSPSFYLVVKSLVSGADFDVPTLSWRMPLGIQRRLDSICLLPSALPLPTLGPILCKVNEVHGKTTGSLL